VSGHKFKIGQLVNYLGRDRAYGVYQVTQLLPPEGKVFQYRIKNIRHAVIRRKLTKSPHHELRSPMIQDCPATTGGLSRTRVRAEMPSKDARRAGFVRHSSPIHSRFVRPSSVYR
jgi:hypothetical protein